MSKLETPLDVDFEQEFSLEIDVVQTDDIWSGIDHVEELVATLLNNALSGLDLSLSGPAEICVMLSFDIEQRALNKKWRGIDKSTNVLSFPQIEAFAPPFGMLGDIVLAYETIVREAEEQQKTFNDHFSHLVVHGFLHILGYDHQNDKEAEQMERTEIDILRKLGINNPYLD